MYQYVYSLGSTPWIVGCYFAGSHYDDALREIGSPRWWSLAVLALIAFATFLTGRGLGRPILRLAEAAQAVRDAGPGAAEALPRSCLTEIDTASQAFNEMVEGLREREQLRATFGRYVPESVVDALVADGGVLRPQTRVCTMLFTDIAGFSTVSERLSPEELIDTLNEYFSVIVEPIERHWRRDHQFQGDAILATYNLPVPQEDHAAQAVRSALEIQEATRQRTLGPGVSLPARSASTPVLRCAGPSAARDARLHRARRRRQPGRTHREDEQDAQPSSSWPARPSSGPVTVRLHGGGRAARAGPRAARGRVPRSPDPLRGRARARRDRRDRSVAAPARSALCGSATPQQPVHRADDVALLEPGVVELEALLGQRAVVDLHAVAADVGDEERERC